MPEEEPAPYLTPDEAKTALPVLATVPDDAITAAVAQFEGIAERALGVAFRPRPFTCEATIFDGEIELPFFEVADDPAPTVTRIDDGGTVAVASVHSRRGRLHVHAWAGDVEVSGTHGHAAPTPLVASACLEYVRRRTATDASAQSRDVLSQAVDGATTRYSTPDWAAGRFTGYLQVDADLRAERDRLVWIG